MRGFTTTLAICLFVFSGFVQAKDPDLQTSEILSEQQAIRADVEAQVGRYADMPLVKRSAIIANQDKLFVLLEGKANTNELSPQQKTEAFNALEQVSAAINNTEDERIVCERKKTTGSHQVTRVCKSVAQIREDRDIARRNMQVNQGLCNSKACAPSLSN